MGANHPQATSSWPRTVIPTSTAGIAGWRGKETTQRAEKWPVASSGHLPDISLWSTHVLIYTGLNFVNPDMPHNTQERHCQRNTVCPCSVYFICALCLCTVCTVVPLIAVRCTVDMARVYYLLNKVEWIGQAQANAWKERLHKTNKNKKTRGGYETVGDQDLELRIYRTFCHSMHWLHCISTPGVNKGEE